MAFSLTEAVLAVYLFAVAIFTLTEASQFAARSGQRSQLEAQAASLARTELSRTRDWLADPSHFSSPASFPGLGAWTASPGGLEFRVLISPQPLGTPTTLTEALYPGDTRTLSQALLLVQVDVRRAGAANFWQHTTLVGEPRRTWHASLPLIITPLAAVPAPLPQGVSVAFQVEARDSANQPVADLMYRWSVIPGGSRGTIAPTRSGKQVTFTHHIPKFGAPGFDFAPPGSCWLAVTANLWGVERTEKVLLDLQ